MRKKLMTLILSAMLVFPQISKPADALQNPTMDMTGISYANFGTELHAPDAEIENSAKAYVLMEMQTGKVLFQKNMNQKLAMASTTKIMTSLLALESSEIDEYFTIDNEAIKVEGTSMGLVENDKVSLRMLAYGMLLASGNDAANVAAMKIGGDIPTFIEMMNERAKMLKMENTNFVTPSGLDADGHYSTAYDMALLAAAALSNPDFAEICSQYSAQLLFGNPPYYRWLNNHNKLLLSYEGCIGVKTGYTYDAGRCLVTAAVKNGVTLICVTLNDSNDWADHTNLYDMGFEKMKAYDVTSDFSSVEIPVMGGEQESINATIIKNTTLALDEDDYQNLQTELCLPKFVYAPLDAGDVLGEINYKIDGKIIYSIPLVAAEGIEPISEKQGFFEKIWSLFR